MVRVPRSDVTVEEVSVVLRRTLGSRYRVTPSMMASGFGKERPGDANTILVAANWLERANVRIVHERDSLDRASCLSSSITLLARSMVRYCTRGHSTSVGGRRDCVKELTHPRRDLLGRCLAWREMVQPVEDLEGGVRNDTLHRFERFGVDEGRALSSAQQQYGRADCPEAIDATLVEVSHDFVLGEILREEWLHVPPLGLADNRPEDGARIPERHPRQRTRRESSLADKAGKGAAGVSGGEPPPVARHPADGDGSID